MDKHPITVTRVTSAPDIYRVAQRGRHWMVTMSPVGHSITDESGRAILPGGKLGTRLVALVMRHRAEQAEPHDTDRFVPARNDLRRGA